MAYTTIKKPSDYFNTVLYTGDGNNGRTVTGVGFQPDLVWTKTRNQSYNHRLFDAVRGATKAIFPDNNGSEGTESGLVSFDSDGFSVDSYIGNNGSGTTYASWNWLASNTTASNTQGDIASTVSANTTSGFSIVSYTGTGANATVGHGLSSAPKFIMFKNITVARNWIAYHDSIGATKFMYPNLTNAETTDSTAFNNTAPTSSVFSLGSNVGGNESGSSMIAYCFSEVKGYSKFGSYTGNGNADGTFIYTGFKPAFVIIRRTDDPSGRDWFILDNKRDTENPVTQNLEINTADSEVASERCDFLSNGFKLTTSSGGSNASGANHIYIAFAEEPLVGDNPATAR